MFGTMSSIGYLRKRRVLSRKHGKAVRLDTVTTPLNLATPNTKKPNQFKVSVIKKADNLSGAITSRKAIRQYGLKRINN
ncbi:MAG: hypothetical protein ACXWRG_11460 [Bdellovibrio sp.]